MVPSLLYQYQVPTFGSQLHLSYSAEIVQGPRCPNSYPFSAHQHTRWWHLCLLGKSPGALVSYMAGGAQLQLQRSLSTKEHCNIRRHSNQDTAIVPLIASLVRKNLISASSGAVKPNANLPVLAQGLLVHHVLVGMPHDQSLVYLCFCRCHSNHCQAFPQIP